MVKKSFFFNEWHEIAVEVSHITVAYQSQIALDAISVEIPAGILLGIIGPNGAGKTTFVKTLLGLLKPIDGTITFYHKTPCAYVPQRTNIDWDFPFLVHDVVSIGRYPYCGWFGRLSDHDKEVINNSLHAVGMLEYAQKPIGDLSGGQQQRVFLARALAQEASIIILDEPFNGVDAASEVAIISVLKKLRTEKKTIIVVHHNMYTVTKYFDWILYLDKVVKSMGPVNMIFKDNQIGLYGHHLNG